MGVNIIGFREMDRIPTHFIDQILPDNYYFSIAVLDSTRICSQHNFRTQRCQAFTQHFR